MSKSPDCSASKPFEKDLALPVTPENDTSINSNINTNGHNNSNDNDNGVTSNNVNSNTSSYIQSQLTQLLESEKSFFLSKKSTLNTLDSMLILSKYCYTQYQQQQHRNSKSATAPSNGLVLKVILDCLQAWTDAIYVCVTSIAIDESKLDDIEAATEKGLKKRLNQRAVSRNSLGSLYDIIEDHVASILTGDDHAQTVGTYGSSTTTPVTLTSEYLLNLYLKSLVTIGNINSTIGCANKSMMTLHRALKLRPNYHEALFGMGLACLFKQQYTHVEVWWRQAARSQPCYWEAVDQLFILYTSQQRQKDNVDLLISALEIADQGQVRATPNAWWKYLSELHSLGETYSFLEMYYEATLVYSWLTGLVLQQEAPALADLGISQRVDQDLGNIDPRLVSLINSVQPKSTGKMFLSQLISDISAAIVKAEKPVCENVAAAPCDNTHIIFGSEKFPVTQTDSRLCVVPPRQALICKYFLLPPMGKIPAKAQTPEWDAYLKNITHDNGIRIVETKPKSANLSTNSSSSNQQSSSNSSDNNASWKNTNNNETLIVQQNPIDIIISNALLNLAKLLQDGICSGISTRIFYINGRVPSQYDILSLYTLSLSLNPNPSIANNIGILLTSEQSCKSNEAASTSTGSGKKEKNLGKPNSKSNYALPMYYYDFGLHLDKRSTHIYTNLGSLFQARGEAQQAIQMYKMAVNCDPKFSIALTNLASALRESGEIDLSIHYYRRAVECEPDFIEAVSGLANSRLSVCDWQGRGGWGWETMSVDENGVLVWGQIDGWLPKVINIVNEQIKHAKNWGSGVIGRELAAFCAKEKVPSIISEVAVALNGPKSPEEHFDYWKKLWSGWQNETDEGARVVQLIEYATCVCQHRWYLDRLKGTFNGPDAYPRPKIPSGLPVPLATTVLPFHAFTLPFNANQVFEIAQRTSIRLAVSSLTLPWLPQHVFPPPPPPVPIRDISEEERELEPNDVGKLVVGYISSDILDHPLAHLMQSVFGFHDHKRIHAICYATAISDGSEYRTKIETECHEFKDVTGWSSQRVIEEIQKDGVHILVNLNGFTRGARNDIFAVRPCPVQISLMGFAGSLGGGWCDYLLADKQAIGYPNQVKKSEWVYKEKIIYMPRSFFVCDHRQSALDSNRMREKNARVPNQRPFRFLDAPPAKTAQVDNTIVIQEQPEGKNHVGEKDKTAKAGSRSSNNNSSINNNSINREVPPELLLDKVLQTPGTYTWETECKVRKELRKVIFPDLPKDAFLMGNLNQLYKIDPSTFKVWLGILSRVSNAYLWLLQFPKSGEAHLKSSAMKWSNGDKSLVDRVLFTPIAEKHRHILRARVCDVFVDTPECNAHTTAADVSWSGTPILTFPRYSYKMCSRIASSVVKAVLPDTEEGRQMASELIVSSNDEYASRGCYFAGTVEGRKRLLEIRKTIFEQRETGDFFDTKQWVRHVEKGYRQAWRNWVNGKRDHIYLSKD